MPASPTAVLVGENLKARNDRQAVVNREYFRAAGVVALNLLSSPGSGKTALLERTLSEFGQRRRVGVVVGDLQTDNDARRLAGRGGPVVPITTGTVCHLEADMVARACAGIDLAGLDLLVIENVGNLVCPASFDLGEGARVVVLSTTEGEDKPLKYPRAFKTAQAVVVSKTDLAAAAGFDRDAALANIHAVAPQATVFALSARTGDGLGRWYDYLDGLVEGRRRSADAG
ncbi:MAG: hydrogenase nickel incorporation protein HypB [Gemmataceae bacterium]|nr:hydrogenase nickel incorporation protein HypB [Gemmataceae bacterium]